MRNIILPAKIFQAKAGLILWALVVTAPCGWAQELRLSAVWNLSGISGDEAPSWIALSSGLRGEVFLLSRNPPKVVQLDGFGKYVNHAGGFGFGPALFDQPQDLYARDGLNVYIADTENNRIQRFGSKLEHVGTMGDSRTVRTADSEHETRLPRSVALSGQGDLFYIDGERLEVVKISRLSKSVIRFGGFDQGGAALRSPGRIALSLKHVFVTDGSRVVQFDYFGNFVREVATTGLKTAGDIAVDEKDRLFVCDPESRCLFVFSSDGRLAKVFAAFDFRRPISVDVRQNTVYVLDDGLNSVIVLSIDDFK